MICRFVCRLTSARIELGSSVDLQLKNVFEVGSTFGEVVSETLLLEARPQAFRVPGLEPGDVGFEVELYPLSREYSRPVVESDGGG